MYSSPFPSFRDFSGRVQGARRLTVARVFLSLLRAFSKSLTSFLPYEKLARPSPLPAQEGCAVPVYVHFSPALSLQRIFQSAITPFFPLPTYRDLCHGKTGYVASFSGEFLDFSW